MRTFPIPLIERTGLSKFKALRPACLSSPVGVVVYKVQPPKNNWAPRIGFAYSPGSSGNTSIRSGFSLAYDTLYDNIGILAVPPQVGSTNNVDPAVIAPGFLAGGGLSGGGGSGIKVLDEATAKSNTANWIPNKTKDPYSVN